MKTEGSDRNRKWPFSTHHTDGPWVDTEETELRYDMKQDICKVSKDLPTRYLLITKGETVQWKNLVDTTLSSDQGQHNQQWDILTPHPPDVLHWEGHNSNSVIFLPQTPHSNHEKASDRLKVGSRVIPPLFRHCCPTYCVALGKSLHSFLPQFSYL